MSRKYNIIITKECYATVNACSEKEAISLGYDMHGESNYDDTIIKNVSCIGELDYDYSEEHDDWDEDDNWYSNAYDKYLDDEDNNNYDCNDDNEDWDSNWICNDDDNNNWD